MISSRLPWWKGSRGEWYVVGQVALFLLVAFGPRNWSAWPAWPDPYVEVGLVMGGMLLPAGFLLIATGMLKLGNNIAAVPCPKDGAPLIVSGPYSLVRHPMYGGAIIMAFGWAFFIKGSLTFVYATILFLFLDLKARREEQWLQDTFCGYEEYQRRVKKLIPYLY
jgi:protein-S-isoprenylcysteine O-methyltransferase Ste14